MWCSSHSPASEVSGGSAVVTPARTSTSHTSRSRAAGHTGPLHACSIYDNKAAGDKLANMLKLGASRPWPEPLAAVSGEKQGDAAALLEYFEPLRTWLREKNQGARCGWSEGGTP